MNAIKKHQKKRKLSKSIIDCNTKLDLKISSADIETKEQIHDLQLKFLQKIENLNESIVEKDKEIRFLTIKNQRQFKIQFDHIQEIEKLQSVVSQQRNAIEAFFKNATDEKNFRDQSNENMELLIDLHTNLVKENEVEVQTLKSTNLDLEKNILSLQQKMKDLEKINLEKVKNLEDSINENSDLNTKADALHTKIQSLESEVAVAQTEKHEILEKYRNLKKQVAEFNESNNSNINELQKEIISSNSKNLKLIEENHALKKELYEKDTLIKVFDSKSLSNTKEHSKSEAQNIKLSEENKDLLEKYKNLKQKVSEFNKNNESNIQNLEEKISVLEKKNFVLTEENKKLVLQKKKFRNTCETNELVENGSENMNTIKEGNSVLENNNAENILKLSQEIEILKNQNRNSLAKNAPKKKRNQKEMDNAEIDVLKITKKKSNQKQKKVGNDDQKKVEEDTCKESSVTSEDVKLINTLASIEEGCNPLNIGNTENVVKKKRVV
ncbi:hypothetical protein HDU92_005583, partial [Lobulomyces angularis]